MRIFIGLVSALALAGCATMDEKRADGPSRHLVSQKDPATVAECTLYAWQSQKWGGAIHEVYLQPLRGGGKTVVSAGEAEFADFLPSAVGTDIKVYFMTTIFESRRDRRADAIRGCL
ncbi:hypothetical protein HU735_21470 [Pseudomonas sp. BW16M2]|uniref:hypothetical protein n=1 Tax=Pseudomonas sp. BW16M2 TaxID=2745489 RepID=UPI0016494C81|nr:hypothetical protein [Pseudomonas sp. BW16M2]MBC3437994.1 hypothetical protein [Pseudomonas sp. BW16M2]